MRGGSLPYLPPDSPGFRWISATKEELVEEVLTLHLRQISTMIAALFKKQENSAAFESFVDYYLNAVHRNNPEQGCLIPRLASEISDLSASASER